MGKPVEWLRLQVEKLKAVDGSRISSLADWKSAYRDDGFRIRRCRPRLFRRIGCKLWDEDEDTGKIERRRVEQKKLNEEWVDEIHSACSGWHFIDVTHFGRLVRFIKQTCAGRPLTSCERRWLKKVE
jgi:hypothetical protein